MLKQPLLVVGLAVCATIVLSGAGSQQSGPSSVPPAQGTSIKQAAAKLSDADAAFVQKVAANDAAEIAIGDLADSHAKHSSTKAFADEVEGDHVASGRELKKLAESKGITLPTTMSAEHQATHDRLAALKDAEFDRAYLTQSIDDHRAAIAEFTKVGATTDPDLKKFIDRTLPFLRTHLTKAEKLLKDLK